MTLFSSAPSLDSIELDAGLDDPFPEFAALFRRVAGVFGFGGGRPSRRRPGHVAIVGAGPGDPELLTLRAARLLQQAEVVLQDRLVGAGVLALISTSAIRIDVGKRKGRHSASQDEINDLLIAHARAGRRVVRLKGGDPFIFGRGGEELQALRNAGIAVEVVPGITAAAGCAAAAGIPLTHRGLSQSVTYLTAHAAEGEPAHDWAALARPGQTLAIYMGLSRAAEISSRLIAHGLSSDTPVAVISDGTLPGQAIAVGRIGELPALIARHGLTAPALIVVGEVAAFAVTNAHTVIDRDVAEAASAA